jgi:hypothetical protein
MWSPQAERPALGVCSVRWGLHIELAWTGWDNEQDAVHRGGAGGVVYQRVGERFSSMPFL